MTDRAPLSREIAIAAAAIEALRVGRALPAALDAALAAAARTVPALSGPSRAAVRDMAHQAARQLGLLGVLTATLNRRPPSPPLAALQIVALSQLLEPIRAEAIIVDQAVEAARAAPGTAPAAGFLNATLRRFLREREALLVAAREDPVARWNHPRWWVDLVRRDHPKAWQSVLQAADSEPPLTLRVNRRRSSVADYLGGIDWSGHDGAHGWYRVMKSRPSFRPLLTEKMEGIPPPRHYADVNA